MKVDAFILRCEVSNSGRSEARHVRANVGRWWSYSGKGKWDLYENDPAPLMWISRSRSEIDEGAKYEVDLAGGGSDFVEVAKLALWAGTSSLWPYDSPFRSVSNYPWNEHRAEITVTAENADTVREIIGYQMSQESLIKVELNEPPPEKCVTRLGILSMLSGDGTVPPDSNGDEEPTRRESGSES